MFEILDSKKSQSERPVIFILVFKAISVDLIDIFLWQNNNARILEHLDGFFLVACFHDDQGHGALIAHDKGIDVFHIDVVIG